MTYNQLFKLEDFLASNLCTYIHLNIEKETTFKDAFGSSYTAFFNNTIVEGLYIVIFPESNKDVIAIYNNMVLSIPDIIKNATCFLDMDESSNLRLIIGVSETKE